MVKTHTFCAIIKHNNPDLQSVVSILSKNCFSLIGGKDCCIIRDISSNRQTQLILNCKKTQPYFSDKWYIMYHLTPGLTVCYQKVAF
ncbi:hypothetical protein FKM82_024950 [Ascaphus truei]